MKVIADRTTVVLAGSFNPSILKPEWVGVHGLGIPAGQEFAVDMLAAVGSGMPPRFRFGGIDYSAGFANFSLLIDPSNAAGGELAAKTAGNILGQLPHTPVSGVGFNFAFTSEEPHAVLTELLVAHDALTNSFPGDAEVVTRRWGNSLTWGESLVNIDCELAGGHATILLNFHYSTASAGTAQQILMTEGVFAKHWEQALAAARALSGEDLEN